MSVGRGGLQRALAVAIALALLVLARESHAQTLDLVWDAPSGCPSGEEIRRDFERSVRVRPGRTPPHLVARAIVEQRGPRWHLRLHTARDGVEGDREIETESCASVARAALLVLSLALGEGAELGAETPSEPGGHEAARGSEAPATSPPPTAADNSPLPVAASSPLPVALQAERIDPHAVPRALAWSVTLDGRYAGGPLPGTSFGFGAGIDARRRWWGASARLAAWPEVSQEPIAGLRTRYAGIGGSLSFCVLATPFRFLTTAACAGFQATALRGESSGATQSFSRVAPWYALLPALRARVPLLRALHVELGFELALSLSRPQFVVQNSSYTYAVPSVAPSAVLGLSLDI
jgi:hypothetical protein